MRILHLMLSNFYIDNANYQENVIPRQNKKDGHEVMIIASTEVFINNISIGYTQPGSYVNEDGISVIRLPYKFFFNTYISKKIRAYRNLYNSIEEFSPDVILFHGAAAYALIEVKKFKKKNPQVRFLVDSHEDLQNSGTNFLSKHILHKIFYRLIVQNCLPYIEKVLYITYETSIFLKNVYGIPKNKLHFFPLGGSIPAPPEREQIRKKIRSELNINEDQILVIHSGKLDEKKRTIEIIQAFRLVPDQNLQLVIIGSMVDKVSESTIPIINSDNRIQYLGWLNSKLLQNYLCAGDLYVQLGGQSATMQSALCCGCAAALYPFESHKFLLGDSVFYVKNMNDLAEVFKKVSLDKSLLEKKRKETFDLAKNILDYDKISSLLYLPFTADNIS